MRPHITSRSAASEERASAANAQPDIQRKLAAAATVPDTRTAALGQLQLQQIAGASSQAAQLKAHAAMMAGHVDALAQRVEEDELLQGKFATVQRAEEDDDEPLYNDPAAMQMQAAGAPVQRVEHLNETGLPDQLKSGVESLSGMSMDHVKVHYNSDKPSQLRAHAYAQGSEIHVAPGQEQHLPHEAWHVVQQAQGRVKPTMQLKAGVPVNDDIGLEAEADTMGAKAMSLGVDGAKEAIVPSS